MLFESLKSFRSHLWDHAREYFDKQGAPKYPALKFVSNDSSSSFPTSSSSKKSKKTNSSSNKKRGKKQTVVDEDDLDLGNAESSSSSSLFIPIESIRSCFCSNSPLFEALSSFDSGSSSEFDEDLDWNHRKRSVSRKEQSSSPSVSSPLPFEEILIQILYPAFFDIQEEFRR